MRQVAGKLVIELWSSEDLLSESKKPIVFIRSADLQSDPYARLGALGLEILGTALSAALGRHGELLFGAWRQGWNGIILADRSGGMRGHRH